MMTNEFFEIKSGETGGGFGIVYADFFAEDKLV